jgi:hypothetical protein
MTTCEICGEEFESQDQDNEEFCAICIAVDEYEVAIMYG